ncbi:hypothetical protein KCH_10980 [Kitasatospora cheerisanensis KCTC 2395]|uniref:Uncharacterized protein n=1 Tax=Kitasatospora cheerisanensis KCTC 2395 TaxID=1348663 RepID=A0A066YZN9_9ACTN|nr:hypothetical protein KCH_10980 [Kitasatospora cheerisanensis KCTC 2395]
MVRPARAVGGPDGVVRRSAVSRGGGGRRGAARGRRPRRGEAVHHLGEGDARLLDGGEGVLAFGSDRGEQQSGQGGDAVEGLQLDHHGEQAVVGERADVTDGGGNGEDGHHQDARRGAEQLEAQRRPHHHRQHQEEQGERAAGRREHRDGGDRHQAEGLGPAAQRYVAGHPGGAHRQQQRGDHQHAHRVTRPPRRPGGPELVRGQRALGHQDQAGGARTDQRGGERAQEDQRHPVPQPVELDPEAHPGQQQDGHHRGERVARRDAEGGGGDRSEPRDDQQGAERDPGPHAQAEQQQAGHGDAGRRPQRGDVDAAHDDLRQQAEPAPAQYTSATPRIDKPATAVSRAFALRSTAAISSHAAAGPGRDTPGGRAGTVGSAAVTRRCRAPSRSAVAEHQDGGVVLVPGEVGDLQHLAGQLPGLRTHSRAHPPQDVLQPGVERERGPFHHAVGHQDDRFRPRQAPPRHRVHLAGFDAERQPHLVGVLGVLDPGPAVGGGPDRRDVAGPGDGQFVGGGVEAEEAAGGEEAVGQGQQQFVGPGQHLAGVARRGGQRPQADPDLAHEHGRLDVVALHVADGQPERPVRQPEAVVPVAADVQAVARGRVPGGGPQPGQARQRGREQLALERHGEFDPGPLEFGVLQRPGGELAELAQQFVRTGRVRRGTATAHGRLQHGLG